MLIEIILAILIGLIAGTLTGLIPGIHINLIGALLISLSGSYFLVNISPLYLIIFISSMAITHTFIDFIPSIYLGCPDTDTELSILPGHELLKKGLGHKAVLKSNYGSLVAMVTLIVISLPSIYLIYKFYAHIENLIPFFLIFISFFLVITEKKKIKSLFIFLLTGILGFIVFNAPFEQNLFPLLTGLFGSSMLIVSIKNKPFIPKQKIYSEKFSFKKVKKPLIGAIIGAPLCSFLPGLGSGQAAIIGKAFIKINREQFLTLIGSINTLVMGFSFISLYSLSKTRTGAVLAIKEILNFSGNKEILILILFTSVITAIISYFLTIFISKIIAKRIHKINYSLTSLSVLSFLFTMIFIISGLLGTYIFIISTVIGIYTIKLGVRRINMMGSLIIPVIIFYLL